MQTELKTKISKHKYLNERFERYDKIKNMSFTLPALPYAHEALEPHFDTLTMQIRQASGSKRRN